MGEYMWEEWGLRKSYKPKQAKEQSLLAFVGAARHRQAEGWGHSSQNCLTSPPFFVLFKVLWVCGQHRTGNRKEGNLPWRTCLVLAICLILPSSSVHFSWDVFEVNLNLLQTLPAPAALSALLINDYLGAQRPYWIRTTPPVLPLWFYLWMPFLSYLVRKCALKPTRGRGIGLITSSELISFKAWWLC